MRRKIASFTAIGLGITLLSLTFGLAMFRRSSSMEHMMGAFRPWMTEQSLSSLQTDVKKFEAAGAEFDGKIMPLFAQMRGTTVGSLKVQLAKDYPAVATVTQGLSSTLPKYERLITTLDKERDHFASADAIPVSSVPATTLPWAMLGVGVAALGIGFALRRPGRGAPVAMVVLGSLLLLAPLAMAFPHKAVGADALNATFKKVLDRKVIAEGKGLFKELQPMVAEFGVILPGLAHDLGMPPQQVQALFDKQFPVFTSAIDTIPQKAPRFERLIADIEGNLNNYDDVKNLQFTPFVWLFLLGGLGTALSGLSALRFEQALVKVAANARVVPSDSGLDAAKS